MFNYISRGEGAAAEHSGQLERADTCVREVMSWEGLTSKLWFKTGLYKWFTWSMHEDLKKYKMLSNVFIPGNF